MTVAVVDVFTALLVIGLFLVAAKALRSRIALFRRLFLPASVIGGVMALLVGPEVLGRSTEAMDGPEVLADGLLPDAVLGVWSELPVLLISVVFAALFIGKRIPGLRQIWEVAGPQVALGQSIAWGQYVIGLLLALLVLGPVFGLPPVAGALIGTVIINWGVRTGRIGLDEHGDPVDAARAGTDDDLDDLDDREGTGNGQAATTSTDPLSIHLGYVAIAISVGWLLLEALAALERATWGGPDGLELLVHLPLFPMAMLGGVILQLVLDRTDRAALVDRRLINRISGAALDLIIVAALGTLSLEAIGGNLGPFLVLAVAGIAWNLGAFLLLAPRIVPEYAYERGLGDFGQSMGMTVTGLLLMRIADPPNRSGGLEAFGYKQLLFEPVVGGGLFTAASVPLIAQVGAVPVLIATSLLLAFWVVLGLVRFGPTDE